MEKNGEVIMKKSRIVLGSLILVLGYFAISIMSYSKWTIDIHPTLEDKTENGSLYNPSTQSFLRGKHWLEKVKKIDLVVNNKNSGSIEFEKNKEQELSLHNIPFELLVPRLHYSISNTPDQFDSFNLMMAEYSRNSLNMPVGKKGDSIAHFRSNSQDSVPWSLAGNYQFKPNKSFRPLRVGVINNCLRPGLWELNAIDRAGEIYHSWFDMPQDFYIKLVAETNNLPKEFTRESLKWNEKEVVLDLERLRKKEKELAEVSVEIIDGMVGFSSQDSRRKLHKKYVQVSKNNQACSPKTRKDLLENSVLMSDFVEPGKYSLKKKKQFSLHFLSEPSTAKITIVKPKTHYQMSSRKSVPDYDKDIHLEISISLKGNKIIIGNLPLPLLVRQEDFVINGFGVGILNASGLPERRALLINKGPRPSYAYLAKEKKNQEYAVNSHSYGIEQIFIRTHPFAKKTLLGNNNFFF